ncbi:DMT family transporter [Cognatishimia sp. SS12]|uniref:DMT family transporter n=1 Tax=Cognatishimia sp. SS12 TaxID=2979465 RepID=UPI00232C4B02|nr:DMT family transporter [Cognatishimia sp. SS12]MDC0737124.1 DMT family transporter [Cognatishimia sp. SS12]
MQVSFTGWGSGLMGVMIFSGSLPATRVAVTQLDPLFLTSLRALIAAVLACALLVIFRQKRPHRGDCLALIIVALGVVVGFPLLTALALEHITAARSTVFIGLLPLATALFGVLRGGERPRRAFWVFSILGSAAVVCFAWLQGGAGTWRGDGLMLLAITLCGLGYAEGAQLSRRLGGWQVISWALLLSAPLMLAATVVFWPGTLQGLSAPVWLSLGYVSLFSMLIGFVFWYRGLALGGTAGVGQLQLLQPFMGMGLAALLLGEAVAPVMVGAMIFLVACVAGAKRFG